MKLTDQELIEIIENLIEYDGQTNGNNYKLLKNIVYKNANKHFGLDVTEEEITANTWHGRLSHGGATPYKPSNDEVFGDLCNK